MWYVCAGFFAFGAIVYLVFASGELQPWAIPPEDRKHNIEKDGGVNGGYNNPTLVNDEKPKIDNAYPPNNFTETNNTRL